MGQWNRSHLSPNNYFFLYNFLVCPGRVDKPREKLQAMLILEFKEKDFTTPWEGNKLKSWCGEKQGLCCLWLSKAFLFWPYRYYFFWIIASHLAITQTAIMSHSFLAHWTTCFLSMCLKGIFSVTVTKSLEKPKQTVIPNQGTLSRHWYISMLYWNHEFQKVRS